MNGPTSLESDSNYILTEPTNYKLVPKNEPQQYYATDDRRGSTSSSDRNFWRRSSNCDKNNLNNHESRIPLSDDYWKIHEEDVKAWKIGTAYRKSHDDRRDSQIDWEYNVQKYENLCDHSPGRNERLQYYSRDDLGILNNKKKLSVSSENNSKPPSKELKFPGLKAFKSASMRLPGQKSSIQEVMIYINMYESQIY